MLNVFIFFKSTEIWVLNEKVQDLLMESENDKFITLKKHYCNLIMLQQ